jgi:hypothetical protein
VDAIYVIAITVFYICWLLSVAIHCSGGDVAICNTVDMMAICINYFLCVMLEKKSWEVVLPPFLPSSCNFHNSMLAVDLHLDYFAA